MEKPGLITRGCFNSLQKKKLKSVDTQMCDRFYSIFLMSGMTRREFVQMCGLDQSSISRINEIKGHVTEPSKNMIIALYENMKVNPNYILIGRGPKYLSKKEPLARLLWERPEVARNEKQCHLNNTHCHKKIQIKKET